MLRLFLVAVMWECYDAALQRRPKQRAEQVVGLIIIT